MSAEEDLELRDLVTQALESNGVLSKIRAELRASVFLALEEQDLLQTENSYANKSFKNFIKTSEGILLTQLVREFLEYFELDFTLSVFDPETSYGKDYEFLGRNTLVKNLKMKNVNDDNGPLLAQILKNACSCDEPDKDIYCPVKEDINNDVITTDDKIVHKKNVKNSQSNIPLEDPEKSTFGQSVYSNKASETSRGAGASQSNILNEHVVHSGEASSDANLKNASNLNRMQNKETKKKEEDNIGALQRDEKPLSSDISNLTSLSNLPPLMNSHKPKPETLASISHGKKDINQLKSMINSLEVGESNYEEDFLSSASGSCVEGRSGKNSLPGSESEEIEEDIGSGIDDLLSNASGLEDLTVDATVSNTSGLGDYMENI